MRSHLVTQTVSGIHGPPKTSCFSLRHKRRCSAAKPEDIGFAGGDPTSPPMSPLRAVVSRGHIAGNLLRAGFPFGRPFKDLAFATPACPPCPGAVARKAPRLCSGGAIRFAGGVAACTSRAATSLANTTPKTCFLMLPDACNRNRRGVELITNWRHRAVWFSRTRIHSWAGPSGTKCYVRQGQGHAFTRSWLSGRFKPPFAATTPQVISVLVF